MTTPVSQVVLDQVARDAAANKPQNFLDKFIKNIKGMKGFQSPAPTSSQAQTARDAKAGADAIRNLKNAGTATSLAGGSVSAAVAAPLVLGGSEDSGIKWRRLGYPSKAAYDTAVKNNASGGKSNNASEINARLKQQAAEKAAALKQTKGDYDHSSGGYTGQVSERNGALYERHRI